ncbi:MAG: NADPH-dependent FMN reductase [Legionella sp.]|nr:MAG: NADPH-dependent FMN reductase [Legionella sp.]
MFQVAVVVGSLRKDSINRKLALSLDQLVHPLLTFTYPDITDIPLYNQDLETDMPESVLRFKQEIQKADAVLWVTPEYNRSIPGVLKNIIDWGTRPAGQTVWPGKVMASMGTSPGAIGTAVAQSHLRSIMVTLGGIFMGQPEMYLVYKDGLIDDSYHITVDTTRELLQKFIDQLAVAITRKTSSQEGQ